MSEPQLFVERDLEMPERVTVAGGVAVVFTHRCPGKTTPNEDCAALIPVGAEAAVLVVADGVGGVRGGHQASALAVRTLVAALSDCQPDPSALRTAILDGIERANQAILDLGLGAATTLAAVEVRGQRMRPYHVGDSMILLVGQRGKVKWQAVPHSPVGYAIEAGVIDEQAAMTHEDRHIVSNVVGSSDMHIEVGPERVMAPRDSLILASDGLCDNLRVDEIIALTRCGDPLERLRATTERARERMLAEPELLVGDPCKPDDLTAILFRHRRQPRRQPKPPAAEAREDAEPLTTPVDSDVFVIDTASVL